MVLVIKEPILKVRNTEQDALSGLIRAHTQVALRKTTSKVKVFTTGQTVVFTKDPGSTTKWKATVHSHGLMVVAMKASTLMIKKKEKVSSTGQTAASMTASGTMASSMVLEHTLNPTESLVWVSGKMEIESTGSDEKRWHHLSL